MNAPLAKVVLGLVTMSLTLACTVQSADAFWHCWGARAAYYAPAPVAVGYAPVAVARPIYVPVAPVAPVVAAGYAPVVTAGYAPAPVTSYYAPTAAYYAPAPTAAYYAPAAAPVTSYYAPAPVVVQRPVYVWP